MNRSHTTSATLVIDCCRRASYNCQTFSAENVRIEVSYRITSGALLQPVVDASDIEITECFIMRPTPLEHRTKSGLTMSIAAGTNVSEWLSAAQYKRFTVEIAEDLNSREPFDR